MVVTGCHDEFLSLHWSDTQEIQSCFPKVNIFFYIGKCWESDVISDRQV